MESPKQRVFPSEKTHVTAPGQAWAPRRQAVPTSAGDYRSNTPAVSSEVTRVERGPARKGGFVDRRRRNYKKERKGNEVSLRGVSRMSGLAVLSSFEEQRVETEVEFQSFSTLRALPVEPDWLWEGFLVAGALTMLSSRPFAGKSTLVGGLLKAIEDGSPFLGRSTKQASALLISEEPETAMRARAEVFGLLEIGSEFVSRSSAGVVSASWHVLIDQATEHAVSAGHSLLVVDTFPGLAGLGDEQENDAGAIGQRLRPLQEAAGKGLAVLFLHHMNGQGQPRGSGAFRGVTDIAVRFYRKGNNGGFRLESESRFPSALPSRLEATLVQDENGWSYRTHDGAAASPSRGGHAASVDERLWAVLVEAGPEGMTYAEIDGSAGLSDDIAKRRLPIWFETGRVERSGSGTKGSPYRWYAVTG
jgi:AAA domain